MRTYIECTTNINTTKQGAQILDAPASFKLRPSAPLRPRDGLGQVWTRQGSLAALDTHGISIFYHNCIPPTQDTEAKAQFACMQILLHPSSPESLPHLGGTLMFLGL
jgi:hypothetical protein